MSRITRFQGAIIRNDHILLVRHHEYAGGHDYWVIPGGGREEGETEQECVKREIKEETKRLRENPDWVDVQPSFGPRTIT